MVCGWGRGKRMWRFKHWYFSKPRWWCEIDKEERIRTLERLRDELEAELEDIRKEIERLKG